MIRTARPGTTRERSSTIRDTGADRLFGIAVYIFLGFIGAVILYPVIYILSSSFSSGAAVLAGKVWLWPVHPVLTGYLGVFSDNAVWTGFLNSIIYTVGGTALSVCLTIAMAYPLSRKEVVGRRAWTFMILFALLFSGGLIPLYLVVKNLGLVNTRWAIILPSAMNIFAVIVAKTFFQTTIPNDLYEAAQLDGCGDFRFLLSVVLPVSTPIIAVLVLWAAVGQWNSYLPALIYLNSPSLYPLQLVLRDILVLNQLNFTTLGNLSPTELLHLQNMEELLKYSLIVISTAPIVALYPFVQKYFVRGIFLGSVKE